jgi:hypothetical protein
MHPKGTTSDAIMRPGSPAMAHTKKVARATPLKAPEALLKRVECSFLLNLCNAAMVHPYVLTDGSWLNRNDKFNLVD